MIRLRLRRWLRRQAVRAGIGLLGFPISAWTTFQRLIVGGSLGGARPGAPNRSKDSVSRILVVRLDLLGDVALSLPAVRSLRAAYPSAEIHMLVRPEAVVIAGSCPAVDRVLAVDLGRIRPSGHPFELVGWKDLVGVCRALRAARYDLAVGLFGVWASFFVLASGAGRRVGFRDEGFPGVYTDPINGRRYRVPEHESRYCLRLARAAGGLRPPAGPDLLVAPNVVDRARRLLTDFGRTVNRPLVVCHAGSVAGDAKRWTIDGWAGFVNGMAVEADVVLVGSEDERSLAERIAGCAASMPILLAGRTTLDELLGVLSLADLVVSGDSGPLHLAGALGRPVLAIHGPSDPRISGPLDPRAPIVRLELECSPCYDATYSAECPLGHHRCMRELESQRVISAALPLLPVLA